MPWKHKPFGWGKTLLDAALDPSTASATVAVLEQVRSAVKDDRNIGELVFHLDNPEPPSVQLAIQLMLDQENSKLKFSLTSGSGKRSDVPANFALRPLWKTVRSNQIPAVAKPAAAVKKACAGMAIQSLDSVSNWDRARDEVVSNSIQDVDSILAVMVFPPAVAGDCSPTQWLRHVQLVAAQWAVGLERLDGVSIANSKVADLTRGPIDWSTDAALVALAQRASEEKELIDEVRELTRAVMARVPEKGAWSTPAVGQSVLRYLELASNATDGNAAVEAQQLEL